MTVLIELVDSFAVWIYIACALTILAYLRIIYLAKRERGASLFTIEKEVATGRAYRATFTILGLLVVISLVAFVDLYLAPTLSVAVRHSTPEGPVVLPTSTNTPLPPTPTPVVTRGPLVRPTPPWTPTPEQSPTPIVTPASCPDPKARITYPGVNLTVGGLVQVRGTATIEDFSFYKVEFYFGENRSEPHMIEMKDSPVENGVLVSWDTSGLSGPVTLRLTVVKSDGNYSDPPCEVPVIVH